MTVTQIQARPEQLGHPARETDGSPRRGGRHPVGAAQQVAEALLVPGVLEPVVGRPAVVDHDAVVVEAQDGLGHGAAAGRVDDVGGRPRPDQGVQPGRAPAHPPSGLVGDNPRGLAHGLADALVDRLAARGGPKHGVDAAATTERNAEEAVQAAGDLAVRQPALLVEFDDGGLVLEAAGPPGDDAGANLARLRSAVRWGGPPPERGRVRAARDVERVRRTGVYPAVLSEVYAGPVRETFNIRHGSEGPWP